MRRSERSWRPGPARRRRLGRALALALLAGVATARIAWDDEDAAVPPGTSLDWVADMPRHRVTELLRIPSGAPLLAAAGPGQTVSRDRVRTMSDFGPTTAMGYARVTTVDITGEVPWTSQRPPLEPKPSHKTFTGHGEVFGAEVSAAYPPPMGDDIFWLGAGTILRKMIHPGLVSHAESPHFSPFSASHENDSRAYGSRGAWTRDENGTSPARRFA